MPDRISYKFEKVSSISQSRKVFLYGIFSKYYQNVSLEKFIKDFNEKKHLIIFHRKSDKSIMGFATVTFFDLEIDSRNVRVVYSGDVVLEKEYWGLKVFQQAYMLYFIYIRAKSLKPVYWYLMSQSYKTYLMMANRFPDFFPNYKKDYPSFEKKIVDQISFQRFGESYHQESTTVDLKKENYTLVNNIGYINPSLLSNPHIAFFQKKNPNHEKGIELVCLAKINKNIFMIFFKKHIIKYFNKFLEKSLNYFKKRKYVFQSKAKIE